MKNHNPRPMRAPLQPAPATGAVVRALRETVGGPGTDRYLAPELAAAYDFLLTAGVENALTDAGITLP